VSHTVTSSVRLTLPAGQFFSLFLKGTSVTDIEIYYCCKFSFC